MNDSLIATARANISTGVGEGCRCCAETEPAFEALIEQCTEWEQSFDLYHKAILRSTKIWRAHHPGSELIAPDTAALVAWLLEFVEIAESKQAWARIPSAGIWLTQGHFDEMVAHMHRAYPNECCGMVSGKFGAAKKVYPLRNIAKYPLYEIHPDDLVTAVNIELAGDDLLAIYHSHPHGVAVPSGIDVANAHYPDSAYIIVSGLGSAHSRWPSSPFFEEQRPKQMRAWRIADRDWYRVSEIPIHVTEPVGEFLRKTIEAMNRDE